MTSNKCGSRRLRGIAAGLLLLPAAASALEMSGRLEWQHRVEMRAVENGVVE